MRRRGGGAAGSVSGDRCDAKCIDTQRTTTTTTTTTIITIITLGAIVADSTRTTAGAGAGAGAVNAGVCLLR